MLLFLHMGLLLHLFLMHGFSLDAYVCIIDTDLIQQCKYFLMFLGILLGPWALIDDPVAECEQIVPDGDLLCISSILL